MVLRDATEILELLLIFKAMSGLILFESFDIVFLQSFELLVNRMNGFKDWKIKIDSFKHPENMLDLKTIVKELPKCNLTDKELNSIVQVIFLNLPVLTASLNLLSSIQKLTET